MSSHSKSSLEAGLAALKQEDYRTAKIILEDVAARDSDIHRSLQAQVALVVAYSKDGEIQMAIAVCESLTQSNNSQIKEWAEKSLKKLIKKYPQQQLYSTGFGAFESSEAELDRVEQVEELISCSTPPPPPPSFSSSQLKKLPAQIPTKPDGEQVAHKQANIHWRLGRRAKVWQPLPKRNFLRLRLLGVGTFIALFWVVRGLIQLAMKLINDILVALPFLEPLQFLYKNPSLLLLGILRY